MADPQQLAAALQQQPDPDAAMDSAPQPANLDAAIAEIAQALGVPPEAVMQALQPLAMQQPHPRLPPGMPLPWLAPNPLLRKEWLEHDLG